jgi:hypothetical protein
MAPGLIHGADHDRAAKMCQKTAVMLKRKEEEKRLILIYVDTRKEIHLFIVKLSFRLDHELNLMTTTSDSFPSNKCAE